MADAKLPACCRHCGRAKVNRPRGLCWSCYYAAGVRERYPNAKDASAPVPQIPIPTAIAPGTPEKMAVLEARARAGQALWHPLDACFEGDQRPVEWLARQAEKHPRTQGT